MGFLNKTRGIKLLGKDNKKKPTAAAAPPPASAPVAQKPVEAVKPTAAAAAAAQLPLPQLPALQVQIPRLQPVSSLPTPPATPVPPTLGSSPWWVSDVTFIVEGKRIPGHKVVLQTRSEYFARLFQTSGTQEVTLEVHEFTHHTFSQLIRWIYGGKKDIAIEDTPDLLRCAYHFEAPELVALCTKMLADHQVLLEQQQQQQLQLQLQQQAAEQQQQQETEEQEEEQEEQETMDVPYVPEALPVPQMQPGMIPAMEHQYSLDPSFIDFSDSMDATDPAQLQQYLEDTHFSLDQDENFGMNMWSNDPILFNPDATDAFRIMEIC